MSRSTGHLQTSLETQPRWGSSNPGRTLLLGSLRLVLRVVAGASMMIFLFLRCRAAIKFLSLRYQLIGQAGRGLEIAISETSTGLSLTRLTGISCHSGDS